LRAGLRGASPRARASAASAFSCAASSAPWASSASSSGQVELVGRQLLGALAEPRALRRAQDVFQPTVGLLHLGQRHFDLGQAGLQMGVLAAEGIGIHAPK